MITDEQVLETLKLPIRYDADSQKIFDARSYPIADIRGWGRLQYLPNGAAIQDRMGEMLAEAFNNAYGQIQDKNNQ